MSYSPTVDLLALARLTSRGMRIERMPGLDYVVVALARAGMIGLSVSQTAPVANQASTAWFKPAVPAYASEGVLYLWNGAEYEIATPTLWAQLLAVSTGSVFQSIAAAGPTAVATTTTLAAIQRAGPAATALTLPAVGLRAGRALQIVDWSTATVGHDITLTPAGGETIMRLANFHLFSTADQLAGVTLYPSTNLSGWVIAP